MSRYYFDLREGDELAIDEEGVELPDLRSVQLEAARSLADAAKNIAYTEAEAILGQRMGIEVRDENGRSVLKATFTFEIEQNSQ